jgi:hypothetical protein
LGEIPLNKGNCECDVLFCWVNEYDENNTDTHYLSLSKYLFFLYFSLKFQYILCVLFLFRVVFVLIDYFARWER